MGRLGLDPVILEIKCMKDNNTILKRFYKYTNNENILSDLLHNTLLLILFDIGMFLVPYLSPTKLYLKFRNNFEF